MTTTLMRSVPLLVVFAIMTACSGSEEIIPARQGERGETCRAANDCSGELACINNVCTQNDFPVDEAAGECVLIECQNDDECWEPSFSTEECSSLLQNCDEFFDTFSCQQYAQGCLPNAECTDNLCFSFQACRSSDDCFEAECVNGRCDASCVSDEDCGGEGFICDSGSCVAGCEDNNDCPYFHQCQSRVCVETGCTTDRECAAYTDSPNATCNDGECQIPCVNDAECNGSDSSYDFYGCRSGLCVYLGCETDEECRIELNVSPGSSFRAVCEPAN